MFIELTSTDKSEIQVLIAKSKIEVVIPHRWQEDSELGTFHDGAKLFLDSGMQVETKEEYNIVRMKLLTTEN